MQKYDNIIIGGGIAGLICGGYLAKAGQKTLILESRSQPGGRITSHAFKGYQPTLHGLTVHPTLGEDGFWPAAAKALGAKVNLVKVGFSAQIWLKGKGMVYRCRTAKTIPDMLDLAAVQSPEPFAEASKQELSKILEEILAWDYARLGNDLDRVFLWDWLNERTRNPQVHYFFINLFSQLNFMDYEDSKKHASAGKCFVIFRQLIAKEGKTGILPKGTLYDGFIKPFADAFVGHGGELRCNATVQKVIVDQGKTKGVLLAGDEELSAGRVIVNCPFPAVPRLFEHLPEEIAKPVRELEKIWMIDVCTFSGLRRKITDELRVIFAQDPSNGEYLLTTNVPSAGSPWTAPPGKHLLWAQRCYRKAGFKDKTIHERYKEIDQATEEIFPGFQDAVEVQTHFSHTLCWQHQYSAYEKIPQKPASISNLYFIGDSTTPQYGTGTDAAAGTGVTLAKNLLKP